MDAQRAKAVGVIQAAWRTYAPFHLLASFHHLLHTPPSLASGEHARTVQHLTTYLTTGPAQVKEDFFNRAQALGFYPFAVVDRAEDDAHNKRGPAEVLWSELLHADNGRALVKAGSVPFLIQSLISDYGGVEPTFLEDFLLTYRTFLTPHALLLLLILRYWVPLGDKDDKREEREKKQRIPIQIKTVRVLRMWIEQVPTDFTDDDVLTANATSFLTGIETFKVASGEILNMLREKRNPGATHHEDDAHVQPMLTSRGQSDGPERGQVVNFEGADDSNEDGDSDGGLADGQQPKPAGKSDRSFLAFDAADVAFEWTLSAQRFYRAVTPREFIKQAWNKKAKLELAPNVSALIEDFNQMSEWVSLVVLSYRDRKRRGEAISRFINIAYECHRLKNYHTVMVVLSGLTKAHITRLKKSWELVDNRAKSKLKLLNEIMGMDSNYQQYRLALREIVPPTPSVPFLGLFLTDLTFLDEGNSELMSSAASSSSSSSSTSTSVTSPSSSDSNIRTSTKRRSFFKVKSDRSVRLESKLRDLTASHSKEDLSASAALIEKSTTALPDMSGPSPRHSVHGGSSASNKRPSLLHKKSQVEKNEDSEKRLSLKSVRSLSVYMKGTSEKMRNLRGRKSTSTFATMDESELLSGWRAEESPRLTPEEQAAVQAWKQLDAQPSADSCMQESGDSFAGGRRSRRAQAKRMPQVFDLKELSEALVKEEKELSGVFDVVATSLDDKDDTPGAVVDKQEVDAPNKAGKAGVEEEMLINWMKQRTMAKVLREFLRFQNCSYPLPKKREKIRRKLKGKLERKSGGIDHSELTKESSSSGTTLLSSGVALDFEGFADHVSDAGMAELEEIRDMLREMRLPPDIANVLDLSTYLPAPASVIPQVPFTHSASESRTPRGSSSTGNSPRSRSATSLISHTSVPAIEALARVTEDQFKSPRASMIATSRTPPSLSPRGPSVCIKRTTSMPTITVNEEPSTAAPASLDLDLTSTTRTFTPRAPLEQHAELFTMKKLKLDDSLLFDLSLHLEPRAGSQVGGAADKKAPGLFVISSPQSSPAATYRARNKIDRTMVGADSGNILPIVEEVPSQQPPSADSGTTGCRIKHSKSGDLTPTASPTARRKNESDDSSLVTGKAVQVVKKEGRPRSNTTSILPAEASASVEEQSPTQKSATDEVKTERRHKDDAPKAAGDDDEGGVAKKASKARKLLKSKKSKERLNA